MPKLNLGGSTAWATHLEDARISEMKNRGKDSIEDEIRKEWKKKKKIKAEELKEEPRAVKKKKMSQKYYCYSIRDPSIPLQLFIRPPTRN